MNFYVKEIKNDDDPLWFFKFSCLTIFRITPVKIIVAFIFLCMSSATITQTILFLQEADINFFIQYQTYYFATFYLLVTIFSIPWVIKAITKRLQRVELWKINQCGPVVECQIKSEIFYLNIYITVTNLIGLICAIFYMIPAENDKQVFFVYPLLRKFFPFWADFLFLAQRSVFPVLSLTLPASANMCIYMCFTIKFQLYMLLHNMKNINEGYQNNTSDELYQETISQRLKACGQRHSLLLNAGGDLLNDLKIFIFLFSVTAIIGMMCVVLPLTVYDGSFTEMYPRFFSSGIIIGSTLFLVVTAGQSVEDISGSSLDILKELDWTDWNENNKKDYLILLANQKAFRVEFSESICINYQLGVAIVKSVYSIASFLIVMGKK